MKSAQVITFGEALIDRLGPPGGDPSIDLPVSDCLGGAPANVACALSRLGVDVAFLGSIGNDEFGDKFKNLFIHRGINIIGLQLDKSRPTRVVLVRRDIDGERSFEGFEGDKGLGFSDQAISPERVHRDWPLLIHQAKWLIVGTIPLASKISSEAFMWCIENAFHDGIKIALDLNWRPTFWRNKVSASLAPSSKEKKEINSILKKVALIKLAKEEAEWFFDTCNAKEISLSLANSPSVIVTDGSNPISWLINNHYGKSLVSQVTNIVDTTGAGDAFTAGIIYNLLSIDLDQISYEKADQIIQFAMACGAHVCQGVGAIDPQPYRRDLDAFLSTEDGGMS